MGTDAMLPHYEDSLLLIHKLKCGPYDNNAYLLVSPQTNESIIVDAPADPGKLIDAARTTNVQAVLITHSHGDHIQGLDEVRSATGARVGIGRADAPGLPSPPDLFLEDGDELTAGTVRLRVIATPGHTPGSTCMVVGKHLFTGDTLFPGGPGRTGTPQALDRIIESITSRLFTLGDDVTFYPGHGDDGQLSTAKDEYRVFAAKEHPDDLCGDVLWLKS